MVLKIFFFGEGSTRFLSYFGNVWSVKWWRNDFCFFVFQCSLEGKLVKLSNRSFICVFLCSADLSTVCSRGKLVRLNCEFSKSLMPRSSWVFMSIPSSVSLVICNNSCVSNPLTSPSDWSSDKSLECCEVCESIDKLCETSRGCCSSDDSSWTSDSFCCSISPFCGVT